MRSRQLLAFAIGAALLGGISPAVGMPKQPTVHESIEEQKKGRLFGGSVTSSFNGGGRSGIAAAKRYARKVRSIRARSPKHGRLKNRVARRA